MAIRIKQSGKTRRIKHPQKKRGPGRPSKEETFAKSAMPDALPEEFSKFGFMSDAELKEYITPEDTEKANHKWRKDQRRAQLLLMHRMLIRRSNAEEIQKVIGVGHTMYYKLKRELEDMIRLDVKKIDLPYYIGDTLALYDEVRSMALTTSSNAAIKDTRVKLQAMQVAMQAERDKNNFLQMCGVYGDQVTEFMLRAISAFGGLPISDLNDTDKTAKNQDNILAGMAGTLRAFAALPAAQRPPIDVTPAA